MRIGAITCGLVAAAATSNGCATLHQLDTQAVDVLSGQPGATVRVNGEPVAQTPATLVLRVNVPAQIEIVAADGRTHVCPPRASPRAGLVLLQSLVVPLWPGLVVDAWTGAWNELEPTCRAPW